MSEYKRGLLGLGGGMHSTEFHSSFLSLRLNISCFLTVIHSWID